MFWNDSKAAFIRNAAIALAAPTGANLATACDRAFSLAECLEIEYLNSVDAQPHSPRGTIAHQVEIQRDYEALWSESDGANSIHTVADRLQTICDLIEEAREEARK